MTTKHDLTRVQEAALARLLASFRPHCGMPSELLLPRATFDALPRIRATDGVPDALALVKFFAPGSNWTWFASEAGPVFDDGVLVDVEMFGLVIGAEVEFGYFSLCELGLFRGRVSRYLPVERDLHWRPRPLAEIRAEYER